MKSLTIIIVFTVCTCAMAAVGFMFGRNSARCSTQYTITRLDSTKAIKTDQRSGESWFIFMDCGMRILPPSNATLTADNDPPAQEEDPYAAFSTVVEGPPEP